MLQHATPRTTLATAQYLYLPKGWEVFTVIMTTGKPHLPSTAMVGHVKQGHQHPHIFHPKMLQRQSNILGQLLNFQCNTARLGYAISPQESLPGLAAV
jgi:hypothetical protein